MRFYEECVRVAEGVGALFTDEERRLFAECPTDELWNYYSTAGIWIHSHVLPNNPYLQNALTAIGCVLFDDAFWFLLEFARQYWRLKQAEML